MSVSLQQIIHDEILKKGPMPFDRFMELSLYHPEWGYYSRADGENRIGRKGDFYTSVSAGGLFGKLLSHQFHSWWLSMGKPQLFSVVECGGFDGSLAKDVLSTMERDFPELFPWIDYVLVEPIDRLVEFQKRNLSSWKNVRWVKSLNELEPLQGIIFGNELLDAFPVRILEKNQEGWKEMFVTLQKEGEEPLIWCRKDSRDLPVGRVPADYRGRWEVATGLDLWLEQAGAVLANGRMLLIDYGYTDEEYFEISRPEGTVRAYHGHRQTGDVLQIPGQQDLTAHVCWTPILEWARRKGMRVDEFIQQGRWLTQILVQKKIVLSPTEIRQFQTLTHPEILGRSFRVLVLEGSKAFA